MLLLKIAFRYLFSKKSTNAINIITLVSTLGLTLGTAALIIILSVFNGFENVLSGLVSNFNPELKITPKLGKKVPFDSLVYTKLIQSDGIQDVSCVLEDIALFEYDGRQDFGKIKGVDNHFNKVNSIDTAIVEGVFTLKSGDIYHASSGSGMMSKLGIDIKNPLNPIVVYSPNKNSGPLDIPFNKGIVYPTSTFSIQSDFDNEYIITSLEFVQGLMLSENQISGYEVKLKPEADIEKAKNSLASILGNKFEIKDRIEQNEAFLKIMNLEKWLSYAILLLVLILVVFNLIGSLWMIVLEKKKDFAILRSMGLEQNDAKNIILYIGMLICIISVVLGLGIGLLFYFLQKQFNIISIPEGFIIDSYPIALKLMDFIIIAMTVLVIGFVASLIPAYKAKELVANEIVI
jgi:lipoprotein-releasing system permease protein